MKKVITQQICGYCHLKNGETHPPEGEPIALVGGYVVEVCNKIRPEMTRLIKTVRIIADVPEDHEEEEAEEKPKPPARARKASGTTPEKVREEIDG